ncbi:hypothetical protein D3C78_1789300 [compost metagenome]
MRAAISVDERSTSQVTSAVLTMASMVMPKASSFSVRLCSSAISVAMPITTAMVPGPLMPGIASGKKE